MRAQAHTLEAVIASLLMLSSVIFALQMTAVTPLSASTSSQHIENQQQSIGEGVLASAAEEGALKPAILAWNESSNSYHSGDDQQPYHDTSPPNRFGELLERSYNEQGIAYNVYFRYQDDDGETERLEYVSSGVPSDNAVRATHTVTLVDDDHLYDADGSRNRTTLGSGTNHRIEETASGSNLYNTVRVEVVAWRI